MKVIVDAPKIQTSNEIHLPISKSVFNRFLILSYLSGKELPKCPLDAPDDASLMRSFLSFENDHLVVKDAGTVMRFGLAVAATVKGEWILEGSKRMQERPLSNLVDAMIQLGAEIEYLDKNGFAPIRVRGCELKGGRVEIDASISSQFISAILMIAPLCQQKVELVLNGTRVSSPYIKMTIELMKRFGVIVLNEGNTYHIDPQTYNSTQIEPILDWSSASFFYEALVLSEWNEFHFPGLFVTGLQGDEMLANIYRNFGIVTKETQTGTSIFKEDCRLKQSIKIDFEAVPDLFQPIFCTAFGKGIVLKASGLYNLHLKESDRVQAISKNLKKLGGGLDSGINTLVLKKERKAFVDNELLSMNDHRMAMSLAPLSLCVGKLIIRDAQCVSKSFPSYWDAMRKLGFEVEEIG